MANQRQVWAIGRSQLLRVRRPFAGGRPPWQVLGAGAPRSTQAPYRPRRGWKSGKVVQSARLRASGSGGAPVTVP